MGIQKLDKKNLSEQIFEQLRQMILNGEFRQGERLPSENELAASFGVSRVSIRPALQKLAAMAIVETKRGEGTFVCRLDAGEMMNGLTPAFYLDKNSMRQISEFRVPIDSEAASLAAKRRTEADIVKLKENFARHQACDEAHDIAGMARADIEFHRLLVQMTGNSLFIRTYDIMADVLMNSMKENVSQMGSSAALKYHPLIIAAIEEGDSDKAGALAREHLTNNVKYFS